MSAADNLTWKQVQQGTHQVVDLFGRGLDFGRIALVSHFRCAYQYLFVPRDDKYWPLVHRLGVHGCVRRPCKAGQNDVRAADPAHHGLGSHNPGTLAQPVRPGPGALMIQVPSTRSSFPLKRSRNSTPTTRR